MDNKTYTVKLTERELDLVLRGLSCFEHQERKRMPITGMSAQARELHDVLATMVPGGHEK
jgi:hypothetical protein